MITVVVVIVIARIWSASSVGKGLGLSRARTGATGMLLQIIVYYAILYYTILYYSIV